MLAVLLVKTFLTSFRNASLSLLIHVWDIQREVLVSGIRFAKGAIGKQISEAIFSL